MKLFKFNHEYVCTLYICLRTMDTNKYNNDFDFLEFLREFTT